MLAESWVPLRLTNTLAKEHSQRKPLLETWETALRRKLARSNAFQVAAHTIHANFMPPQFVST
jgi:hypothetical protein